MFVIPRSAATRNLLSNGQAPRRVNTPGSVQDHHQNHEVWSTRKLTEMKARDISPQFIQIARLVLYPSPFPGGLQLRGGG